MPEVDSAKGDAVREAIRYHRSAGDDVHAVVEGSLAQDLVMAAREQHGQPALTLFADHTPARMAAAGPFLIPIDMGSSYVDLWADHLGSNAGILLLCGAGTHRLREHLRTVFVAKDEHCQRFYFRFYDPRVLRSYCPTCTAADGRELFGPIERIIVEGEARGELLVCAPSGDGVSLTRVDGDDSQQEASSAQHGRTGTPEETPRRNPYQRRRR